MGKFRQLINPHSHAEASLDGASTVAQIVARNLELGATHVALTDHGTMASVAELVTACKEQGAKPIPGIELYLENPFKDVVRAEAEARWGTADEKSRAKIEKAVKESYVHLTAHFRTEKAYLDVCKLSPQMEERAVVKWGERKPVMLLSELESVRGEIVLCSSCLIGGVMKWLSPKHGSPRPDLAEKFYCYLREVAGKDQFFVELFPHKLTHEWQKPEKNAEGRIVKPGFFKPHECIPGVPDGDLQRHANEFVLGLARKYGDPVIISLDSHFAKPEDKRIQNAKINNGIENWIFHNSYHIYTSDEAAEVLKETLKVSDRDIEEWIDNSYRFASLFDSFKLTTDKDRWVLEPLPENWQDRIMGAIDRYGRMDWENQEMVSRLQMELDTLTQNGRANLAAYLLPLEDIARYCRENGVMMNVRGSAGGSLLLYLLGISVVNPLKHDLSFGRFLTLGRVKAGTLPDVDVDIATGGRDEVVKYLESKYGDRICRISTDMQTKLKTAIKDAERSEYGTVSKATEQMCFRLPQQPQGVDSHEFVFGHTDKDGNHTQGLIDQHAELAMYARRHPQVWSLVTAMLGIRRQKGVHACAFVIADKPVQEYIPVTKVSDNKVTAFSPKSVEKVGLVKYDFLGLNTLRDIQVCLQLIKEHRGIDVDPWHLPHDPECFTELAAGKTEGVFQFDTPTVRPYVTAIRPKTIDDLAAITSLCRPGCLDAPSDDGRTLAEVYVARAQGEQTRYVHDDLASILGPTFGIQLFQEQSMAIFRKLANYSDEQAETVRRGIGKKDKKVLESCMADLRQGCKERGWSDAQIDLLISQIMASARYSFNKSHAISYSYVAYACMYLKRHYAPEWWTAVLRNADPDDVRDKGYGRIVRDVLVSPHVNGPTSDFELRDGKIHAPLNLVNGVGSAACNAILANRNNVVSELVQSGESEVAARAFADFSSFQEFYERVSGTGVNSKVVQNLILVGAFSLIEPEKSTADLLREHYYLQRVSNLKAGRGKVGPELMDAAQAYQATNPNEAGENVPLLRLQDFDLKRQKLELLPIARIDVHEEFRSSLEKFVHYAPNGAYVEMNGHKVPVLRTTEQIAQHFRNPLTRKSHAIIAGLLVPGKEFEYADKKTGAKVTAYKFNVLNDGDSVECVLWPQTYIQFGQPMGNGVTMVMGNIKESRDAGKYSVFVSLVQELA